MITNYLFLIKPVVRLLAFFLIVLGMYLTSAFISEFFFSPGYFKGTHNDFLAFYTTGQLAIQGQIDQVYNEASLTQLQRMIVPHPVSALGYMPFLNPPFVAMLLAPLGWFSVNDARLGWVLINIFVMIGLAWYLTRSISVRWQRGLLIFLVATAYPVFQNLIQGQLSIIIVAGVIAGIHLASQKRLLYSGVFLSILAIKPQLAILLGIGLIFFRQWEIIKGMVIGTAALVLMTLPFTGLAIYKDYADFSTGVTASHVSGAGQVSDTTWKGNMKYMYSLPGLSVSIFGQNNVTLTNTFTYGIAAILIGLFLLASRKQSPTLSSPAGRLMLATGIAIILLINPHAYSQDAILLLAILAIILPIWRDRFTTIIISLAIIGLMFIDHEYSSHWTTVSLILFVICVLYRITGIRLAQVMAIPHKS